MLERLLLAITVTFSVYLCVESNWFDATPTPSLVQRPTIPAHGGNQSL
ncbi:MAG TPA: hypothetical protein V6D14_05400 [Coleofasciculaceae cyanobacterium]|jgi:hypothetical protein